MAKKTSKRIDIFYVQSKLNVPETENVSLMTIAELLADRAVQIERHTVEKDYKLVIIPSTDPNLIIGYVQTILHYNLPPTIDDKGKTTSINTEGKRGLAYSNIFLFDKTKECIFYESNISGCNFNTFRQLLEQTYYLEDSGTKLYDITASLIFNINEYERICKMLAFSKIEFHILAPELIVNKLNDQSNPLLGTLKDAIRSGSRELTFIHKVERFAKNPLDNGRINKLVTWVKNKLLSDYSLRDCVKAVVVSGVDPDTDKSSKIDLLGQNIIGKINLEAKRSHGDLQINNKKKEIIREYERLKEQIMNLNG
ncbi:hypothetical protein [Bacteroides oleiciplenus]|mgnify:CR=1 FL=1|uniref:Uncharacterized protein n=1 Tax=Bacteroides oleiciplenus TaxID=626931 RepID=A0A3E5BAI1_9BACE|nr:hypothetical protein [Bacteroides oleiciplenus]RGN34597.1 hypothetical protein DXB65_12800 [Bacteroides oleiciplenus]